jgi:hypothetical protein
LSSKLCIIVFQLLLTNNQDKLINELRTYLDLLGNKYPKVFENEKLTSLIRHNSTESMTSLNSIYSQRSFQSTSEVDTSLLGFKKKRNWFRSSFIKAFNRKATADCKKSELDMDFEITSPISQQEQTKNRYSDADEKSFTSLLNSQFLLSASASHQQFASTNTQGYVLALVYSISISNKLLLFLVSFFQFKNPECTGF